MRDIILWALCTDTQGKKLCPCWPSSFSTTHLYSFPSLLLPPLPLPSPYVDPSASNSDSSLWVPVLGVKACTTHPAPMLFFNVYLFVCMWACSYRGIHVWSEDNLPEPFVCFYHVDSGDQTHWLPKLVSLSFNLRFICLLKIYFLGLGI